MEVADQWRREWAGTAEYGKVTEGGVTRRIARAMEVLHASAPGAKVRVLRAAYHSSAGPGAPASSYMLHSSRRVISSGFNFLESPTTPNKPLELCSIPLESSPEPNGEVHDYKVTEPDDTEISEPSKWRGSTGTGSLRMPSEESSSTDNASIIDLTGSAHLLRKYSYDSETSDSQWVKRGSARTSPLLDAPVTLSTLKYKSLLNGSTEWNNRRKSYSFENTSPINETILHSNDTLAMESSTDSGICKSSEIVNDSENAHSNYTDREERQNFTTKDESFKDWLTKKRQNTYKRNSFKTHRQHEVVLENPTENNNFSLQSTGKVSITLPVMIETDSGYQYKQTHTTEESDRRVKKVEFCKTEVHFAAESGKVNIIATDEKPPPSNDFRKRRSAFVPMTDMLDKHITLFGEKNKDFLDNNLTSETLNTSISEFEELDENIAATKSILKNKIPKPKPYLLGENMALGLSNDYSINNLSNKDNTMLTAVSLINRQLNRKSEMLNGKEVTPVLSRKTEKKAPNENLFRTIDEGSSKNEEVYAVQRDSRIHKKEFDANLNIPQSNRSKDVRKSSPQGRLKTRQLRDSDLTYFGIDNGSKHNSKVIKNNEDKLTTARDSTVENIFRSVRLIQQVSNSVCNSEAESEDSHDYQNVPMNANYTPIPTPRRSAMRSKYDDKPNEVHEIEMLNTILEQNNIVVKETAIPTTRRSKLRRYEETTSTSRSISEPPKNNKGYNSIQKSQHRYDHPLRSSKNTLKDHVRVRRISPSKTTVCGRPDTDAPIYENVYISGENANTTPQRICSSVRKMDKEQSRSQTRADAIRSQHKTDTKKSHRSKSSNDTNRIKTSSRSSQDDDVNKFRPRPMRESGAEFKESPTQTGEVIPREVKAKLKGETKSGEKKLAVTDKGIDIKNHSTRHTITSTAKCTKGPVSNSSENKTLVISSLKRIDDSDHKINTGRSSNTLKKESIEALKNLDPNKSASDPASLKSKSSVRKSNHNDFSNGHIKSKRSEYVINYDDKNGTVSSICKIKTGPLSSKKKKHSNDILKETSKDNTVRHKALDKTGLRK